MNLDDIIDETQSPTQDRITKTSKTNGGMALSLDKEAHKLSRDTDTTVLAEQRGEGRNTGFGLAAGQRLVVQARDGKEGGNLTAAQIMRESDMLWRYYREPIPQTLDASEAPAGVLDHAALYRVADDSWDGEGKPSSGVYLGTVGRETFSTDLDPHAFAEVAQEAMEVANRDHGGTWAWRAAIEMKGGAYHGLQSTMGDIETPRGPMSGRLTIGTGYAGTDPLIASISSVMAVCQNTWAHALEGGLTVRHTANMLERIEQMVQALLLGQQQIEAERRWMERADRVKVSIDDLVKTLAPLIFRSRDVNEDGTIDPTANVPKQTQTKREALASAFEESPGSESRSLLDVAQAMTYYTSHEFSGRKRRGGKEPMSVEEQHIHGTARQIQEQGWEVLYSMCPFQESEAGVYLPA